MTAPKLCRDCRHVRPSRMNGLLLFPIIGWATWIIRQLDGSSIDGARCAKDRETIVVDPISGRRKGGDFRFCCVMRCNGGDCGPEGRLWEGKE